ncbi:hypothetical protein QUB77_07420 [Microcoleus sp. AT9b-C3]|uniref:hypothetical protein n=1 Tax=Microcoleus sp. AT9_A5 TaxID=2818625 RepID=UPI002FCE8383
MSFNEGRGKKEEGRRKREEGRRKRIDVKIFSISHSPTLPLSHSLAPSPPLRCGNSQDIAY